jgi:uncharacterized protein YukE
MAIKIDTEKLETNIMFLKNDISEIDAIIDNLKQATEKIDQMWESKDADIVKTNLKNLYSKYDDVSTSNKNFNSFLDKIVIGDYTALETDIDKLIDEKISIE